MQLHHKKVLIHYTIIIRYWKLKEVAHEVTPAKMWLMTQSCFIQQISRKKIIFDLNSTSSNNLKVHP